MSAFEQAFEQVQQLVNTFQQNFHRYLIPGYGKSKKKLDSAKTDSYNHFLQNKCCSLDRQIDKLGYQLYELTGDEIKIMEGNA